MGTSLIEIENEWKDIRNRINTIYRALETCELTKQKKVHIQQSNLEALIAQYGDKETSDETDFSLSEDE